MREKVLDAQQFFLFPSKFLIRLPMYAQLQDILHNPVASLAVIGNLIIIESLLSVDNAAVLATLVSDLPRERRKQALQYGIVGAYLFRGLCLLFASYLVGFWFLKPLGGLYLLYLTFNYFGAARPATNDDDDAAPNKRQSWLYRRTLGLLGPFWATVAVIELMDLAFSIDNVFAVVAFSNNLILIVVGVFIGILAMRLVAQYFVGLMGKYPFLETAAFVVIGILGLKQVLSLLKHFAPGHPFSDFLDSEAAEAGLTVLTIATFGVPLLTSRLLGWPRRLGGR